ncbi:hypothetical protein [Jannaschia aquimarina]|nr:hypothetical protein [Jannaschia aquimarina]
MRVNDKPFLHLSIRTGTPRLHIALLEFYAETFNLERAVMRDEGAVLSKEALADMIGSRMVPGIKALILNRGDGTIEDIRSEDAG